MLPNQRAVEIISRAKQKNVAQPRKSIRDFENVIADFLAGPLARPVRGQRVLDLGPGQFDFARLLQAQGAMVESLDYDPAVIELGGYLGCTVRRADFKDLAADELAQRYDGVFCKFSINAFWWNDPTVAYERQRGFCSLVKPSGWGWIAPWNGRGERDDATVACFVDVQNRAFRESGWQRWDLSEELASRYGITGSVLDHPVFLIGVTPPALWTARGAARSF
ncbi:MAG: hypothetical protein O3C10_07455 [Chloroflexi bacterium]|nr:hypothetical protein [Chloroflexota bacterium]